MSKKILLALISAVAISGNLFSMSPGQKVCVCHKHCKHHCKKHCKCVCPKGNSVIVPVQPAQNTVLKQTPVQENQTPVLNSNFGKKGPKL